MRAPQAWLLRAVIALGPTAAVLAGLGVDAPPAWLIVVLLGLGLASARWPDSGMTAVSLLVAVWWWAARDGVALHAGSLGAAAALLATHVAATLAAQGPASVTVSGPLMRLWVRRGAACLLASVPVWLLARAAVDHEVADGVWFSGLVLCVVVGVIATVATHADSGGEVRS